MSIEQLKSDLKDNLASVKSLDPATATSADLVRHLKDTFWPFIESTIDEMEEIDESVAELADMMDGSADVLCEESGTVFAGIIAAGLAVASEAEKLLPAGDHPLKAAIAEYRTLCKQGAELLNDIVLPDADDDDEDEDDNTDAEDDK